MNMTSSLRKRRKRAFATALLRSERGATAVEYGLILAMVVLGAFAAINGVADRTTGMWDTLNNRVAEST